MGVSVIYTPYGKGVSSSSLKEKIRKNYAKLKKKADSHLPLNAKTKE